MIWFGVPRLFGNLARDAICFCRVLIGVAVVETVPAAYVDKRKLYEEPKGDKTY